MQSGQVPWKVGARTESKLASGTMILIRVVNLYGRTCVDWATNSKVSCSILKDLFGCTCKGCKCPKEEVATASPTCCFCSCLAEIRNSVINPLHTYKLP